MSSPIRPVRTALRRAGVGAAVLSLALTFAACSSEDGDDDTAKDPAGQGSEDTGSSDPSPTEQQSEGAGESEALPEWAPTIVTDDADGVTGLDFADTPEPGDELEVFLVKEGDGPEVQKGQTITANYFGSVYGSDQPFDESYSSTPFQAPIGVGSLIPGWDQALVGVPVGSRVLLSIPPELGYGKEGSPPVIPPNAHLFFVLDIIEAA